MTHNTRPPRCLSQPATKVAARQYDMNIIYSVQRMDQTQDEGQSGGIPVHELG